MKYFLTSLLLISFVAQSQNPTVREVVDKITTSMETSINPGSVDTLKSGTWEQEVTGIATTFMTTMAVLKKAVANDINLILTHEPTFFNHFDYKNELGDMDPVVQTKLKYIEENNLVIFRFHDLPHQIEDDMIKKGMVRKLGWESYQVGDMIFESPYESVYELAEYLSEMYESSTVRVVGDPELRIFKIGMLPGAYGYQGQVAAYNNEDIQVLIVGESREWETVPYALDAQEQGIDRALIVMGHADSEEGGMEYTADWLKGVFPDFPVMFIQAGNPLWTVK